MKQRILDFYEDHKPACNVVVAAASVATVMMISRSRKKARTISGGNGSRPTSVDLWTLDGGSASMIMVKTMDGSIHPFIRGSD